MNRLISIFQTAVFILVQKCRDGSFALLVQNMKQHDGQIQRCFFPEAATVRQGKEAIDLNNTNGISDFFDDAEWFITIQEEEKRGETYEHHSISWSKRRE